MLTLGQLLSDLLRTWPYSIPVLTLAGLTIAWLGFAPSEDPPSNAVRAVPRRTSPDLVSRTVDQLATGVYRPSVEALWFTADRSLQRTSAASLGTLPRTRAGARRRRVGDLGAWKRRQRDLLRLLALADRLERPPLLQTRRGRRRARREFERLTARVVPEIDGLARQVTG